MPFLIRDIRESDLPEIIRWFDERRWPLPPVKDIGAKVGAVAEKDGVLYACIYAYLTGTSIAFLEWPGTNPDIPINQAMEAFDEIVAHYKAMCQVSEPKVRALSISTQSKHLAERFKNHGFKLQDSYIRALWTLKE